MTIITLTRAELRKIIRESLMIERPFSGIPLTDFNDAVIDNAAMIAGGADPNASSEEVESAKAFMNQLGESEGVINFLVDLAEKWNNSPAGWVIKVPGMPGAENYDWSDAALDAFLLVAGGGIAGGLLGLVGKAGARGAAVEVAAKGIYNSISARVGQPLAKKAVQQGLKSIASTPTDTAIKKFVNAAKEAASDNIEIKLTAEQFKEAMELLKAEGKQALASDTEIAKLAADANETFGIEV